MSVASPMSCFRSWSTWSRHIMRSDRNQGPIESAWFTPQGVTALLPACPAPTSRRRDLTGAEPVDSAPNPP